MIYILTAPGFEEVEALAPVDLLRRAELEAVIAGVGSRMVTGSHGIQIISDMLVEEVDPETIDMLVLPGGMPGTLNLEKSPVVQKLIDHCVERGKWVCAICAAPSILGHKGLLEGKEAICFPGFESELAGAKLSASPVVRDGKIITAKGAGVAIDFGLMLVEVLKGQAVAQKLRSSLQCSKI